MAYRIALNFEDGATRIIACNPGETVLKAAYRQQVNLPVDCSDGVCGTCKCRAESGTYDLGDDYIDDALTQDEAEEGLVLTCQMVPSSDCVVAVPVPTSACKIKPAEHTGTVTRAQQISPSTLVLELALDKPEALDFLPGQYVNLTIPGSDDTRAYSFSSAPGDATARFLIRNVPGGRMSGWLTGSAQPGDAMRFTGPNGSFFLRPALRPILMLAGGTGLAPLLSMLAVLGQQGCAQRVHLVYGVTHDADLVELDAIESLGAAITGFTYATVVSDAASDHPRKGYVTAHLADEHLNKGDCDVYLCGPPPMVEAVRVFFRDKGITPASFHYEKFAASEVAPA